MSDIDLAVTRSRKLEQMLERGLGASGRGLHEKTTSVEREIPADLVRKLRLVATVRNKIVHEATRIDDRPRFLAAADDAERELAAVIRSRGGSGARLRGVRRWAFAVVVLAIAAAVTILFFRTF